jgi:hypothetical protein
MDQPKSSISPYDPCARIGFDAAPIAVDVLRPAGPDDRVVVCPPDRAEVPGDPLPESSIILYCDSEREVREGFAIALRAMGITANFLISDIVPPAAGPTRENN